MFRLATVFACTLLATSLPACTPQNDSLHKSPEQASSSAAQQAHEEQQAYQDQYKAARALSDRCAYYDAKCLAPANKLNDAANAKLIAAITAGDPTAADYMATEKVPDAAWRATSKTIINRADSLLGTSDTHATIWLTLAGYLTTLGEFVPRNYDRATLYYGAAWLAGDASAAASAANVYNAEHDLVNAYLWALRCTSGCTGLRVETSALESSLDTPTIRLVQAKAADRSTMGL
ncbi:hypothetical protein WT83_27145 [Burkholderia territorii]|uniref:Lipoprotein n=1 Tax=Burkholderia territorii TaxID=1503055 RepID=A0A125K421_9BURK|nr:hypothetical protein [Burkholderia territorii]KWN06363.1 hypothetical protein WT83_27145 [Burkholderia territorii]